nr:hypothetical protein [Desulfobulbus rhabdoformis]
MEMPLVAEGLRKLAMLSRLIATGSLLDSGYLFWDEPRFQPESKIDQKSGGFDFGTVPQRNPGIHCDAQPVSASGAGYFAAEPGQKKIKSRFFSLSPQKDATSVEQGCTLADISTIVSLDEELAQSERFLEQT